MIIKFDIDIFVEFASSSIPTVIDCFQNKCPSNINPNKKYFYSNILKDLLTEKGNEI